MTDKAQRRTQILQAAERLLEHYGVHKTTVADIAREASIGVGTVYLEFGSKDDIIERVASQKHDLILGRLEEAARQHDSCAGQLRAVLDTRLDAFVNLMQCGTHACDLVHCDATPVESAWRAYQTAERQLVRDIIAEGVEQGELDSDDVERSTDTVLRAYLAFSPPWVFRARSLDAVRQNLQTMHALVLDGLRAR